jgi:hypothetical protein
MREMVKHPTILAKCFSDNPGLFGEAKREVDTMLHEMERALLQNEMNKQTITLQRYLKKIALCLLQFK